MAAERTAVTGTRSLADILRIGRTIAVVTIEREAGAAPLARTSSREAFL
jgi:hypothetical protein